MASGAIDNFELRGGDFLLCAWSGHLGVAGAALATSFATWPGPQTSSNMLPFAAAMPYCTANCTKLHETALSLSLHVFDVASMFATTTVFMVMWGVRGG